MRPRLLLTVTLSLFGCSQQAKQDDRICTTPPGAAQGDWASCVHRWAYRLARAPGPNGEIAEAAVSGCYDAIEWEVENSAEAAASDKENLDKMLQTRIDASRKKALFHVVQARAGHCKFP